MRDPESPDPELPQAAELHSWLSELLPAVLPTRPPSELARGQLLSAAQTWPLRYAPFYDRLGQLWDLSEPELKATFSGASHAKAWQRAWPGLRFLLVNGGPGLSGARARLLHFAPGVRFPRHRHKGSESILVLEGSYTDGSGLTVRAGDEQEMRPGTDHELVIGREGPCVAGVVERGLEFTGPVLKLFGRWFSF